MPVHSLIAIDYERHLLSILRKMHDNHNYRANIGRNYRVVKSISNDDSIHEFVCVFTKIFVAK